MSEFDRKRASIWKSSVFLALAARGVVITRPVNFYCLFIVMSLFLYLPYD